MCWSPAHLINWMLIALVSLIVLVSDSPVPHHLICSGEYSQLSYDDCQGSYHNITSACYFLEGFGHYKPCADVCNNVLYPSREEGMCKFRCKDYAHNYCHVGQLGTDTTTSIPVTTSPPPYTATTAVSTSPIPYTTTKTYIPSRRGDEKKSKKMTTQQQTILGLAIGLPLFFLILLGILVACCWKKVKNWPTVQLTNKKRTPDKKDQKSCYDQDLLLNDEVNAANEADIPDDRKRNTAGAAGGVNGDQGADPDPQVHAGDERRNNPPHHLTLKGEGGTRPTQATGTNDPDDLNPKNSAGAAGGDDDAQSDDSGERQRDRDNLPPQEEGGNKPTQATGTNDPDDLNPEDSAGAAGWDNGDQGAGADSGDEQRDHENGTPYETAQTQVTGDPDSTTNQHLLLGGARGESTTVPLNGDQDLASEPEQNPSVSTIGQCGDQPVQRAPNNRSTAHSDPHPLQERGGNNDEIVVMYPVTPEAEVGHRRTPSNGSSDRGYDTEGPSHSDSGADIQSNTTAASGETSVPGNESSEETSQIVDELPHPDDDDGISITLGVKTRAKMQNGVYQADLQKAHDVLYGEA